MSYVKTNLGYNFKAYDFYPMQNIFILFVYIDSTNWDFGYSLNCQTNQFSLF